MSKLQTDEKTAIQTALESIRANDRINDRVHDRANNHDRPAQSLHPAARSRSKSIAIQPFPSPNSESFQGAVKPFPSPESESLQIQMSDLPANLQTAIQTALQNGFPGQTSPPLKHLLEQSGNRNPAAKSPSSAPSPSRHPLQELEAQANRISQLSRSQEAALQRLRSIADQYDQYEQERNRANQANVVGKRKPETPMPQEPFSTSSNDPGKTTRRPAKLSLPLEQPIAPPQSASPFSSESSELPESVSLKIKLPPEAQKTAAEVAQRLRQPQEHLNSSDDFQQTVFVPRSRKRPSLLRRLRRRLFPSAANRTSRHHGLNSADSSPQSYSEAAPSTLTLRETLTLILGAALTRLLLNLLLESLPLLTVPVMILLVLPAAIALYKATTAPQSGILWGYRLCIIVLGLLIGGRL